MTARSGGGIKKTDSLGKLIWDLQRRPDRFWLSVVGLCYLSDGRLLLLDGGGLSSDPRVHPALCFYSSDGAPIETIALRCRERPRELWIGSENALIVCGRKEVLLFRIGDQVIVQLDFGLSGDIPGDRYVYRMSPGSDRVLLFDRTEGSVAVHAIPR
jgi:hypothetical protein